MREPFYLRHMATRAPRVMRIRLVLIIVAALVASAATPVRQAAAQPAAEIVFDIPAQPLENALLTFGQRAGIQLLYDARVAAGQRSTRVSGRYTPMKAIDLLLAGTGLSARPFGSGGLTIVRTRPFAPGFLVLDRMEVAAPRSLGQNPRHLRYAELVEKSVSARLREQAETASGRYVVELHLWLSTAGRIARADVAGSSGSAGRDAAVAQAVATLDVAEPPPDDMPQPIRLEFQVRPGR